MTHWLMWLFVFPQHQSDSAAKIIFCHLSVMNKRHFPQTVYTIPLLHHHIQEPIQAQYLQAEQFDAQRLTAKHIATQHRFCREQRKHAVQKTASCMSKHCFLPCHSVLLAKLKAVFHKEGDNTQIPESLFLLSNPIPHTKTNATSGFFPRTNRVQNIQNMRISP